MTGPAITNYVNLMILETQLRNVFESEINIA